MTNMTFDKIVELVDQLTPQEQTQLTTHLLELVRQRQLTVEERKALLHANVLSVSVANTPSPRREDWYDNDGR